MNSLAESLPSTVGRRPALVSDAAALRSQRAMTAIRAALVARGSSLRQWAHAHAADIGLEPEPTYQLLRRTIQRRLDRGLTPLGEAGGRLVAALRSDLGAAVVPEFAPQSKQSKSPTRRRFGR